MKSVFIRKRSGTPPGGQVPPGGVAGVLGVRNQYRVRQTVQPLTSGFSFGSVLPNTRSIPQEAGQEPEKSEQGSAKTPEGLSAWTEIDSSESVESIHALTPALVAHAVDELSRNASAACKRFPPRAAPPARASTSRKSRIVRRLITRQPEITRTVF